MAIGADNTVVFIPKNEFSIQPRAHPPGRHHLYFLVPFANSYLGDTRWLRLCPKVILSCLNVQGSEGQASRQGCPSGPAALAPF